VGSPDSGTTTDAGCPGFFCDGFERDTVGAALGTPWTTELQPSTSTATIDNTRAHSGSQSLKLTVSAGSDVWAFAVLSGAPFFPTSGNVLFGRMWIWITDIQIGPGGSYMHVDNIEGSGILSGGSNSGQTGDLRYGIQVYPYPSATNWTQTLLGNYADPTHDNPYAPNDISAGATPVGTWSCYEWRFAGPGVQMNFWLNGQDLPGMDVNDASLGTVTLDTLRIGWRNWQASSEGNTVWIDDFAVGTSRLGCQ
jgi:hypothetical protein